MSAQPQTTASESSVKMLTYKTRFGDVFLREDRLISFPEGILGFSNCTVFGLSRLPDADESPLMLMQCVNEPEVAFLVADPLILGFDISEQDRSQAIKDAKIKMNPEDVQFLTILTLYDQGESYYLTANLKAPLLVDGTNRVALQQIMTNPQYTTQHKI